MNESGEDHIFEGDRVGGPGILRTESAHDASIS